MNKLKKVLTISFKGLITIAIIILLINKLGWEGITTTVTSANPLWLIAALVAFLISTLMGVIQWRILLQNRGITLPFGRTGRLYFIGMFFNLTFFHNRFKYCH